MARKKGNKRIYSEPTIGLTVKVPESKIEEIRVKFYEILDKYVKV